jgi:hypothetical protein
MMAQSMHRAGAEAFLAGLHGERAAAAYLAGVDPAG